MCMLAAFVQALCAGLMLIAQHKVKVIGCMSAFTEWDNYYDLVIKHL